MSKLVQWISNFLLNPKVNTCEILTHIIICRLTASGGQGGPSKHGRNWQRKTAVSGSSPQLTLKKGAPGDQVWDLLCVQLASYLERGPLMWMMPLHLHINQKSDYDIIYIWSLESTPITLCLMGNFSCSFVVCNFFSQNQRFRKFHSGIPSVSNSFPDIISRSGSKLFAKFISRQQNLLTLLELSKIFTFNDGIFHPVWSTKYSWFNVPGSNFKMFVLFFQWQIQWGYSKPPLCPPF